MVVVAPPVQAVELLFACDTTRSMKEPIRYGKKIIDALVAYLAGLVDAQQFEALEVVVHLVGMNDWKAGEHCTHPVKLFLNLDESLKEGRPVGYSFQIGNGSWNDCLEEIKAAVEAMAESTRTSIEHGDDAREEYGTGLHFIQKIVEESQKRNAGKNVKYFLLAITDDMQHGYGPEFSSYPSDSWPEGVTTESVYGRNDVDAYKYGCPYAPDQHPLGFPAWKPHSFWTALNGVLDLGVTVVWAAIGNSAQPLLRSKYSSWLGTMATIFNYKSGVLLSWHVGDPNKNVPATVVHLLNTLITSASIEHELDEERKRELALAKTEALMTAAKEHSQRTNGPLKTIATSLAEAAAALDELVVDSDLAASLQDILVGRTNVLEDDCPVVYRSLEKAAEAGDAGSTDREMAVAYQWLLMQSHRGAKRARVGDADAPVYRSFRFDPDDVGVPSYRSLGAGLEDEPSEAPPSSISRLVRLSTK